MNQSLVWSQDAVFLQTWHTRDEGSSNRSVSPLLYAQRRCRSPRLMCLNNWNLRGYTFSFNLSLCWFAGCFFGLQHIRKDDPRTAHAGGRDFPSRPRPWYHFLSLSSYQHVFFTRTSPIFTGLSPRSKFSTSVSILSTLPPLYALCPP